MPDLTDDELARMEHGLLGYFVTATPVAGIDVRNLIAEVRRRRAAELSDEDRRFLKALADTHKASYRLDPIDDADRGVAVLYRLLGGTDG